VTGAARTNGAYAGGVPRSGTATAPGPGPALVAALDAWAARRRLPTPAFGFVRHGLAPAVQRLRAELGARVSYSVKANPHPLVLAELVPLVAEFNVTNLAHLDRLLALGVAPHRLAWLHPVLTPTLASAVLDRGVRRFVVDDQRGLDLLLAAGATDAAVTLRMRPPDAGEAARSVIRFGNDAQALRRIARSASAAGLPLEAISFFAGTSGAGMAQALPFRRGIESVARLYEQLDRDRIPVGGINIGGAFPGARRTFYRDHPDFFALIRAALDADLGPRVPVLCEPGRYLAEPAFALLTRVLADRTLVGRRLVCVDASGYGGLLETTFIDPEADLTVWAAGTGPATPGDLLGPVMDSFDVIRKDGRLPALRPDDLLVLPNVGAYCVGYTTQCEGIRAPAVVALPDELSAALSEEWLP
jgi:ornithine decarboxylase